MIAPHVSSVNFETADEQQFDDFVGRSVFGIRTIGDSQLAFAFELPWMEYRNEDVRRGLKQVAPEVLIEVPHPKVGESRGPAGDLLVWYQPAYEVATAIVTWVGLGVIAKKVIDYLRSEAPSVLITDGTAMSVAANAIHEHLNDIDLTNAFVLPSALCADLGIEIAGHAFLCGFSSDA